MEHPFLILLDHTQRRSTVGRTPLDEWSARRRDLYLTTHDTCTCSSQSVLLLPHELQGAILLANPTHWYLLYVFFWIIPRRLNFICRRFGTLCLFHVHRLVGDSSPTNLWRWNRQCSETSAYKIQAPGNYPKEKIQQTNHGESLKLRINWYLSKMYGIHHGTVILIFRPLHVLHACHVSRQYHFLQ